MIGEPNEYTTGEDIGLVTAVGNDRVKVEVIRTAGCKSCSMQGFCFSKNSPAVFDLETDHTMSVGDKVQLSISPKGRVFSSLLIFIVPVLFLFTGYLLSSNFLSELMAALMGFVWFAFSFLIIHYIDKKQGNKLSVRIVGVVEESTQMAEQES